MDIDFDYSKLEKEFEQYTDELKEAYSAGDYYKAVCYLKFLSSFYYQINYKFTDDVLENITQKVAYQYLGNTVLDQPRANTIVFYDNFGLENRGLANIYVNAINKLQYQVVWILHEYAPDKDKIIQRFGKKENICFRIIPKLQIMERMKYLQELVLQISPSHIFIYTTPDDVEGIGVFSTVIGNVKRYLIDLTDHAFWLGKCASDYFIECRNIGCNIAMQYRNIDAAKLLILPYYPDKRDYFPYEGMPFGEDKEFVFSGGSVYKIEGSPLYEEMVTHILENYPQLYFVYAGNDKSEKLNRLSQKFRGRFYQIPERRDLDEVLRHAKMYLSTYPIAGGLMTQYALQNQCYPLCLRDKENDVADPITCLLNTDKIDFAFYSVEALYEKLDMLMRDNIYYESEKKDLQLYLITEEEFVMQLGGIFNKQQTSFDIKPEKIKVDNFTKLYKDNMTFERYCEIIYNSHNPWIWNKHPEIITRMGEKRRGN